MACAPACGHVIVTENKINFLTLPQSPDVLAIFGGGYAFDLLRALPWIANQPLHYWGDLDTHGLAILSRFRQYFPHTRSFRMDCDIAECGLAYASLMQRYERCKMQRYERC